MADRFPRPYTNSVPKEGTTPMMETVDFDRLGIGARKSGLPDGSVNGIKNLEHVGSDATKNGK